MKHSKLSVSLMAMGLVLSQAVAAQSLTVSTTQAGTLSTQVGDDVKYTTSSLTVTGPLNGADILYLRQMFGVGATASETTDGKLDSLDLSGATIVASDDVYYTVGNTGKTTSDGIVGDYFFYNCKRMAYLVLPATTAGIGENAFGNVVIEHLDLPEGVKYLGKNCLAGQSKMSLIHIPASVDSIAASALTNSAATQIVFAEGSQLRYVGQTAFANSYNLESISLPASVEYIGKKAFSGCEKLTSFTFPASLREIADNAFAGCSVLTTLSELPASVELIGDNVFQGTAIQNYSVSADSRSYVVRDGILYSYDGATLVVAPVSFSSYELPSGVTTIAGSAFYGLTNLKSITLNDGLAAIGQYAFCGSGIESVTIPASVTSVGSSAFQECPSLAEVVINCTSISDKKPFNLAFASCDALTLVTVNSASAISFYNTTFSQCANTIQIYVPSELVETYTTIFDALKKASYQLYAISTAAIADLAEGAGSVLSFDLLGRRASGPGFCIRRSAGSATQVVLVR